MTSLKLLELPEQGSFALQRTDRKILAVNHGRTSKKSASTLA